MHSYALGFFIKDTKHIVKINHDFVKAKMTYLQDCIWSLPTLFEINQVVIGIQLLGNSFESQDQRK
jgi:hypothetical protein